MKKATKVADIPELCESGYRVLVSNGHDAEQAVDDLHGPILDVIASR